MTVPKISQLRPGVGVNIVLKAHQRSGRLTKGSISEILTRGDHPRGVKVRLTDGQVGRVQSLSAPSQPSADTDLPPNAPPTQIRSELYNGGSDPSQSYSAGAGSLNDGRQGSRALQVDYRHDPTPRDSCSLADYIRVPSSSSSSSRNKIGEPARQAQMESLFPTLDSALIAAILADYADAAEAKNVLSTLS